MTIEELSRGIAESRFSCEELTLACLQAIAANDHNGRNLSTVSELDPNALFHARAIDAEIRKNGRKSALHGVPVLIKDNIDVKDLHTCAGSYALHDLIAAEDAPLVKKLRDAGALILGKTNLSEFAYFMSTDNMPNGYSSMGGQVIHAYDPAYDCSGSSSGSAVAVSARFVPYAIGTETDGSLMSPAAANSIVSIKPTVGLVSRSGIVPISHVQDTAGPMANCVEDLAQVLTVIAGYDEDDPATYNSQIKDYMSVLKAGCSGLKIGILANPKDELSAEALQNAKEILEKAGAEVCDVAIETVELDEMNAMIHEFRHGIDLYLSKHSSACRSLQDVVNFNKAHAGRCLVHGQDILEKALAVSGHLYETDDLEDRRKLREEARELLEGTLKKYNIDMILSAGKRPVGNLAPVSGNPCLSLPARSVSETPYRPLNFYMMAGPYCEDILLRTAYTLEQQLQAECRPSFAKELMEED